MLHGLNCLSYHDWRLVVLAGLVCAFGCYGGVALSDHARSMQGRLRSLWLLATGVTSGSAIWATHFIAMLAFDPGGPRGFALAATLMSLIVPIVGVLLAIQVSSAGKPVNRLLGGLIFAGAVTAMHYVGMSALQIGGRLTWDEALVACSVALGALLSAAAFDLGAQDARESKRMLRSGLFVAAILVIHFLGMASVTITPDADMLVPPNALGPSALAVAVAASVALIFVLSSGALFMDRRGRRRTLIEAQNLRDLADAAIEGLVILEGQTILAANKSFEKLAGARSAELIGVSIQEFIGTDYDAGADVASKAVLVARTGESVPIEIVFKSIIYAGERRDALAIRDLRASEKAEADRKASAAALEGVEEELSLIFSSTSDIMSLLEADGDRWIYRRANDRHLTLSGNDRENTLGRSLHEVLAPQIADFAHSQVTKCARTRQQFDVEMEFDIDGRTDVRRTSFTPLIDADGVARKVLTVVRDISDEVQAKRRAGQSQKLEAIGQLAGGVAHDFNNLLLIIGGYAQMALSSMKEGDASREALSEIVKASDRGATLVKQLLIFSRRQVADRRVVTVSSLLREARSMLQPLLGTLYDVRLLSADGAEHLRVETDPAELTQVILNLSTNARDAMPAGGLIELCLDIADVDEAQASGLEGRVPGRYAQITLRDTGQGMSSEVISKIFQPFFSTKDQGKGTGLGLAMVYGFVEQSKGLIKVQSQPGRGTAVEILLPTVEAPAELKPDAVKDVQHGGGETILLVEDEPALLSLTRDMLEYLGYRVLTATNGAEALEMEMEHEGEIDLVLSDLIMPEVGGVELAEMLARSSPDLPIVLMSGHPTRGEHHAVEIPTWATFMQKPFNMDGLAVTIHKSLAQRVTHPIKAWAA